jgi:pimeloyl-ACP methyl ester carboxylesterase
VPRYDQDVLCATYPVWENRETRQGRKIGLNVVILKALGPDRQPDPIFVLGGGPGQAIAQDAAGFTGSPLRRKRDIVLVDQRGTGGSNALHCSFYGEPVDPLRAAGELFPVAAVRQCREKLEKVADLSQYTTAAFADDLNEVRRWLGYGKINPRGKVLADVHEPVRSDTPVLLISGERDPVTPPESAERAARFMTNRLHVVIPRGGHGDAGDCTARLIEDFTDRASVQGLDPSCVANAVAPVSFAKP